jgi:hypothetical protein
VERARRENRERLGSGRGDRRGRETERDTREKAHCSSRGRMLRRTAGQILRRLVNPGRGGCLLSPPVRGTEHRCHHPRRQPCAKLWDDARAAAGSRCAIFGRVRTRMSTCDVCLRMRDVLTFVGCTSLPLAWPLPFCYFVSSRVHVKYSY